MNRRDLLVLAALLFSLPSGLEAQDFAQVKARGELRVLAVLEERTPEFYSEKPGGPPGFDREVLEAFGRRHGLTVKFIPVASWPELVPALLAGKGDMVAGRVSHTEARAKLIDFTDEVFPTRDVIFNYAPEPPVATMAQLLALPRVGTLRGTSMADSLAAAGVPPSRIEYVEARGTLPALVQAGTLPAGAWALEAAIVWQRTSPGLQIGLFLGPPRSLAYGVPKDAPQLLAALNEHLRLVKSSGTWNRLAIAYFGPQAVDILKRARESGAP
jgi:ABC-type amino acid transport substrate-binding protein